MTPWAFLRAHPFTSKCLRVPRSTFNSIMLYDQGRERQSSRQEVELGEVGCGEVNFQRFMQTHKTSTLRLTDRDISISADGSMVGNQIPLWGLSSSGHPNPVPMALSLAKKTLPNLPKSTLGPGWPNMLPLDPKLGPRTQTLCTSCFPAGSIHTWSQRAHPDYDVAPSCPSEDRPFPLCPLGGNHKNKPGASFVPRGMFSPCSHFMKLFGPEPRQ